MLPVLSLLLLSQCNNFQWFNLQQFLVRASSTFHMAEIIPLKPIWAVINSADNEIFELLCLCDVTIILELLKCKVDGSPGKFSLLGEVDFPIVI